VAGLDLLALDPSVEGAVAAVRDFLGMEVVYTSEFVDDLVFVRTIDGDAGSFGFTPGGGMPLEQTYCQRVLDGRLPNLIPDVAHDERAASLPISKAAGVGAFVSVPLTFADGEFYGTLCAASHQAQPSLGYRDLQFLHVFARMIADQIERKQLREETRSLEQQATAVTTLMAALSARDGYTGRHSQAVVDLAGTVAEHLGLGPTEIAVVRDSALLHDIGKIAVPDAILNKPGPLTESEWEIMRTHPISGEAIVQDAPGLDHLAPVLRAEHERWDGTGYPDGLAGEAIPLASRITLVCDAYEAMTSARPYRRALSRQDAREEIARGAGTQFCPSSASALLEVIAH
jgi:response regulator RpfG family c-di-GMP phosphodiesterase